MTVPQAIQKLETYVVTNQDFLITNNTDDINKLWPLARLISFPDLLPRFYHHAKPYQEKPSLEGLVHGSDFY